MNRLSDYQTFLTQFLRNYETTGSVIPSGRALGSALCRYVGDGGAPQKILEAGPGTGAVTGCIIDRLRHDDQLWMVELNPTFAAHLRSAFKDKPAFREAASRCHLIEGSVQQLGPRRTAVRSRHLGPAAQQFLVRRTCSDILQAYAKLLKPGGILSFFQYILIRPAKMFVSAGPERDRLKGVGEAIEGMLGEREFAREWVWVNVPPAWVHHIQILITKTKSKSDRERYRSWCVYSASSLFVMLQDLLGCDLRAIQCRPLRRRRLSQQCLQRVAPVPAQQILLLDELRPQVPSASP